MTPSTPKTLPEPVTPRWQVGTWTLTAPDGRTWQADSPLKACGLEQRERVPPEVALQRIFTACDEGAALAEQAITYDAVMAHAADWATITPYKLGNGENAIRVTFEVSQRLHGFAKVLAAQPPAVAAIPEGWKLVPIDATVEMVTAAIATGSQNSKAGYWSAMLAAAPQPPAGQQPTYSKSEVKRLATHMGWEPKGGQQDRGEVPIAPPLCPITGAKFWGNMAHPERGMVAVYGGPLDSFTIPTREGDGELRAERYDQDAGSWVEGGHPIGWCYPDQMEDAPATSGEATAAQGAKE